MSDLSECKKWSNVGVERKKQKTAFSDERYNRTKTLSLSKNLSLWHLKTLSLSRGISLSLSLFLFECLCQANYYLSSYLPIFKVKKTNHEKSFNRRGTAKVPT